MGSPHTFHYAVGTSTDETITRAVYNEQIRDPLVRFFTETRPDLRDHIRYIVLTKGVPLRIEFTAGGFMDPDEACVDSELTQLFTGNVPDEGQVGVVRNPFYDTYRLPERHHPQNLSYMVFRLDAYQSQIDPDTGVPIAIKRLIDNAQNTADDGVVLIDGSAPFGQGNDWMLEANRILGRMGIPTVLDTTVYFQKNQPDIIGYCSWGSHETVNPGPPYYGEVPAGSGDVYPGTFLPGAVGVNFVSTDGRTFVDGNQSYGQSLAVDLLELGMTAVTGHVYEPFAHRVAQPQILFPRYFQGLQLGTAFYQAILSLSWQNVIVCDPLQTSNLTGALPPQINNITPHRVRALRQIRDWTFTGRNFTGRDDMSITLYGEQALRIRVSDRKNLVCNSPRNLQPGIHDVTLNTFMGTKVRRRGLIVYPAMEVTGADALGQPAQLDLHGLAGDGYLVYASFGTAELATRWGTFWLDPSQGLQRVLSGRLAADVQTIQGIVPDDPSLSGLRFYLQAFLGPSLSDLRLSNLVTVTLP